MKKTLSITSLLLFASFASAQAALPAGTAVKMKLETTLATFSSKTGDPFSARVTEPVILDGKTVIPIGTTVEGRVSKVKEPRRIAGRPTIAIFPEHLDPGSVIAAEVFNSPGMVLLFYQAATSHDFPILLGSTLVVGVATVAGNLAADIAYGILDPRGRHGG